MTGIFHWQRDRKASLALAMLVCFLNSGMHCHVVHGQQPDAKSASPEKAQAVSSADMYRPTRMPDRIVLTWSEDPATTQSVTWRTSTDVRQGLAEITVCDAGPALESKAARHPAESQDLQTDINTARFHSVTFRDLQPATAYAYRVGDGVNWSEWFHFRTASSQAEPFSFIYFGDAQNDLRSLWSRVVREAFATAPRAAFMIHAGDLINRAEADAEWGAWCGAGAWMNAMIPSVPVPGNHEQAKGDGDQRRLSHHWRPQFCLPTNGPPGLEETCYTLVYQNVRVIGLNSNQQQKDQVAWLDRVLSENECPWVICTFHHPMFSTGKDRDNAPLREMWKPVLDKHRVDLVLQGHDHSYGRTGLDTPAATAESNVPGGVQAADMFTGTVYVVSVSGPKMYGLQHHPFMPRQAEFTQLYQVIHIDGDQLQFAAYMATGELYDAFTLTKQPGMPNQLTEQIPDVPERMQRPVVVPPQNKAAAVFSK